MLQLTNLPNDIIACQIFSAHCLGSSGRWRLRCTSKKLGQLIILAWIPRPLFDGGSQNAILLWMFRRVVATEQNAAFLVDVVNAVRERRRLDCVDALVNWIARNDVCIDSGGFYSPLRMFVCNNNNNNNPSVYYLQTRVRIGWWEQGVCFRRRWSRRKGVFRRLRFAVAGFKIYYSTWRSSCC
jgi:hypothetical protein